MSREEAIVPKRLSLGARSVVVDSLGVALIVAAIATPVAAGPVCTLVMERMDER